MSILIDNKNIDIIEVPNWFDETEPQPTSLTYPINSKPPLLDTENYQLHPTVFKHLTFVLGVPHIDLFATQDNKQTQWYCSITETDRDHPHLITMDAFKLQWSDNRILYANPPFSAINRVIEKVKKDQTRRLILIAPLLRHKEDLLPLAIEDIIVLDTVDISDLFLPPDRVGTSQGIGVPPWGDTAAFTISGDVRSQRQHLQLFQPKIVKLSDLLRGKDKTNLSINYQSAASCYPSAKVTENPTNALPSRFRTIEAALNAKWDDVKAYAVGTEFKQYSAAEIAQDPNPVSAINTTPLYTHVTINGFNVIAILDSGSGVTLVSNHPALQQIFDFTKSQSISPIRLQGLGKSETTTALQETLSLRGQQGQYVSIKPTFLIVDFPDPTIIVGNDTLNKVSIITVATPTEQYAFAGDFPDFLIPCSTSGKVPDDHINSEEVTINGFILHKDTGAKKVQKSFPVSVISGTNPFATLPRHVFVATVDAKIDGVFTKGAVPSKAVDPSKLSLQQFEALCEIFELDRFLTSAHHQPFESLLRSHLDVKLDNDPLVIFTLILILRTFDLAFSFPGHELGCFTGFKCKLELINGMPQPGPMRPYKLRDQEVITKWIQELVKLNVYQIVDSTKFASDIHVVYKEGKDPRPTGDYRLLNLYTRDIPLTIHHMERVLDWTVHKPFLFISDCDNNKGFYQCELEDDTRHLLALRTPIGIAIPNRCSMGPKQIPGFFQAVTQHVMGKGNWKGVAAFVDNLHIKGIDAFWQLFWIAYLLYRHVKFNMTLDLKKCHWLQSELRTLGFIISNGKIGPDPSKIEALQRIKKPEELATLRSYLGHLTFYARFFPHFATRFSLFQDLINDGLKQYFKSNPKDKNQPKNNDQLLPFWTTQTANKFVTDGSTTPAVTPTDVILLEELSYHRAAPKNKTKKQARYLAKIPIQWTERLLEVWEDSKKFLTTSPVLCSPLPGRPIVISCDSSTTAQNGIIEQYQPSLERLPLAYYSRIVSGLKKLWPATLLELDGACWVLKKSAQFIDQQRFTIIVDHRAIAFIRAYQGDNQKLLSRALFLAEFGSRMTIVHKPGYLFLRADPLSRMLSYTITHQTLQFRTPEILNRIRRATTHDPSEFYSNIRERLLNEDMPVDLSGWWYRDGLLYHNPSTQSSTWRVYVPEPLVNEIIEELHVTSGHLTYEYLVIPLTLQFWWPKFTARIKSLLKKCRPCLENKAATTLKPGLSNEMKTHTPLSRWNVIHCDFLSNLEPSPRTQCDGVVGITCRFSSRIHIWPITTTITGASFASMFIEKYIPLHGVPTEIISDRDPRFMSEFWKTIRNRMGLQQTLSTTDHPQSNGLQERHFKTFNQIMRCYVNLRQDDWEMFLPLVEFNMNSIPRKRLNKTPFEIDLGYQPTLTFASELRQNNENRSLAADALADLFQEQDILIKEIIRESREYNQEYVNQRRREEKFNAGDFVMLSTKNIKEFDNKLCPRWIGPLKILQAFQFDTYKLELPERYKRLHPNFHVSKLKRAGQVTDHEYAASLRKINAYQDPLIGDDDHEIDKIVDHKMRYNKPHYRVRFKHRGVIHDQ
jgi:hypothetical protein